MESLLLIRDLAAGLISKVQKKTFPGNIDTHTGCFQ